MPAPEDLASGLRRDPFRFFFPLGLLLVWAGVGHWFLHAVGVLPNYHPVFHSIAQVQGFLMCFAAGFLFTAIPRWTDGPPPAAWRVALALLLPPLTTAFAWAEHFVASQLCWLLLAVLLLPTAWRAVWAAPAQRPLPASLVWVPGALLLGIVGSLLVAFAPDLGLRYFWLHDLGRVFLLQGMFLALVLGLAPILLPRIAHGDPATTTRGPLGWPEHLIGLGLLTATLWFENAAQVRPAYLLRAILIVLYLHVPGRLWRRPLPTARAVLPWLSAWMLPLGYVLAAAFPLQARAGLHVVFIGGLALMALSVGLRVSISHGGGAPPERGAGAMWAAGVLLLLAAALRAMVDFDPPRFFTWLGAAALVFLLATLAWVIAVAPRLWHRRSRPPA